MSLWTRIQSKFFVENAADKKRFGRPLPNRICIVGRRLTGTGKAMMAGATIPLVLGWAVDGLLTAGFGYWSAVYAGAILVLCLPAVFMEIDICRAEDDGSTHWKKSVVQGNKIIKLEADIKTAGEDLTAVKAKLEKEQKLSEKIATDGDTEIARLNAELAAAQAELKRITSDPLHWDMEAEVAKQAEIRRAREDAAAKNSSSTRRPK